MISLKFLLSFRAFLSVIFLMIFENFQLSDAAPVVSSEVQAMMYIQKHGYMNESSSNEASLMSEKAFLSAIKDFQRFAGLSETGLLDNSTLTMMDMHRNGVRDKMRHSDVARRKSQVLQERLKRQSSGYNWRYTPPPDLCQDSSINAATITEDGRAYVFKGDYYWELNETGIVYGYPRRITEDWSGLPGDLDAALTVDGQTFFFKKHQYWSFRDKDMHFGYPKEISVGFEGIPDNIDAAFVWSGNMETYFFKGRYYWKFNSQHTPPVSSHYPQSISIWKDLPSDIDAAIQWTNQRTYFFKGQEYYRFDDKAVSVEKVLPPHAPYPRPTSHWWFDCLSQSSSNEDLSQSSLNELDHTFHVDEDANTTDSTIPTEDVYDDADMKSSDEMDVNMGRYGIAKTLAPQIEALDSATSSLRSANNVAMYLFLVVIAQWLRMHLLSI